MMKKLFTSLLLLGVALCSWGAISVKSFTADGVLTLTSSEGDSFTDFYQSLSDDRKSAWYDNVTKLVLEGPGFTNADFNGGKMGEFIANCAGSGNTLYLDLTNASGLVSQVTFTSTDKNPVANPKFVYSDKLDRRPVIQKNGEWGYYAEYYWYPDSPNENTWTTVTNYQTDPNTGEKYVMVTASGTPFSFGTIDNNNNSLQQNFGGPYLNGISFPNGDNFTAIPDKLCNTVVCPHLTTVVWGNKLEWIGEHAFRGGLPLGDPNNPTGYSPYSSLVTINGNTTAGKVTFPTTLKVIGKDAFYGCVKFTEVDLSANNQLVKIDAAAFNMVSADKDANGNNINSLTSVKLPGTQGNPNTSLKFFGNQVFSSSHITTLDFTYCEGITNFAYDGQNSMEEGTWTKPNGSNTSAIGENTFYWYQDLETLILPPNLKYISGGDENKSIARECPSLTTVTFTGKPIFGDDCQITNGLVITNSAFLNCQNLTTVNLSDNITEIQTYAFSRTGLTQISIPASVQTIQEHAFTEMGSLTKVIFEDIPEDANCQACKDKYQATTVKSKAFQEATKITDVYINNTSVDLKCENEAFNRGTTFGHGDINASLAVLHFPQGKDEKYTNTTHYLTNEIAMDKKAFHEWLVKHFDLAKQPHANGWYEFVNSGPSSSDDDLVFDGNVILRTFSDYTYARIVPEGLRAYVVNKVEPKTQDDYTYYEATLQRLFVIPAKTGVILYGQPNTTDQDNNPSLMMPVTYFKEGEGQALCRENWHLLQGDDVIYKNYLMPILTEDGTAMHVEPYDYIMKDGKKEVTFRNFALNRMDQTRTLHTKVDDFSAEKDNYAAFFRIKRGDYPSGYAYLQLTASEYKLSEGAEVIVKKDDTPNSDVPYYMEYNKDGDPYNPKTLGVDENGNNKNKNHFWEFADWDERTKNWGVRSEKFNIKGAISYLGEFEEDTDGVAKLIIPVKSNDDYYTLQGVKVSNPSKGVYIQNGKKVIIK